MNEHKEVYLPNYSKTSKEILSAADKTLDDSQQFLTSLRMSIERSKTFNKKSRKYVESLKGKI